MSTVDEKVESRTVDKGEFHYTSSEEEVFEMNAFNAVLMASQLPILEINSDVSVSGEASTREATKD